VKPESSPKRSRSVPERAIVLSEVDVPLLPTHLDVWQQTMDWQPDAAQLEAFQKLYALILAGNQILNLTRLTEPEDFWEKHLWDSLRGLRLFLTQSLTDPNFLNQLPRETDLGSSQTVIDIGTGAGFPGVPGAIARSDWQVTLLDSTHKKVQFLEQLTNQLALKNVATLSERVETVGQSPTHRTVYDIALLRAVAPASVCAEYALPLLTVGGVAVLYRGQWSEADTADLKPVVQYLGGTVEAIETFQTPLTRGDRACIYLRKTAPTPPEFPRAVGVPAQKPLGFSRPGEQEPLISATNEASTTN